MLKNLFKFFRNNFNHINTAFFFMGFIVDSIFLPDYLSPVSRYLGAIYIAVAATLLLIKNNGDLLRPRKGKLCDVFDKVCVYNDKINYVINLAIAFVLGSGLSFVFIYYYRSVQVSVMWPILIVMLALMCMNEFVKNITRRALMEIAILMFTVYLYFIYVFPTLFYNLTTYTLVLSVVFALLFNIVLTRAILWEKEGLDININRFGYKLLAINIFIPVVMGILYITNNLPAVPVTLRSIEVYNEVQKSTDKKLGNIYTSINYDKNCARDVNTITDKKDYWNDFKELFIVKTIKVQNCGGITSVTNLGYSSTTIDATNATSNHSNRITVYTAVYMPGYFFQNNIVSHIWSHYENGNWVEKKRVSYPIVSGRDGGYRGYTYIDTPVDSLIGPGEGHWKIRVMNSDNRLIGEYRFNAIN